MINFWLSQWVANLIAYSIAAVVVLLMCVAVCIVAHIQKKKIKDRDMRTRDKAVSDIDVDNIKGGNEE